MYDPQRSSTLRRCLYGQGRVGELPYVSVAVSIKEPTPTLREVKVAIKQHKNNKSAGKDGIGAGHGKVDHLPPFKDLFRNSYMDFIYNLLKNSLRNIIKNSFSSLRNSP